MDFKVTWELKKWFRKVKVMPCVVSEAFKEASKGVSGGFRGNLGDFGWTSEGSGNFRGFQENSRRFRRGFWWISRALRKQHGNFQKSFRGVTEEFQGVPISFRMFQRVSRGFNGFSESFKRTAKRIEGLSRWFSEFEMDSGTLEKFKWRLQEFQWGFYEGFQGISTRFERLRGSHGASGV